MTQPLNSSRRPPLKLAGVVFLVLAVVLVALVYLQFRGDLTPKTKLTMVSDRAGLVMDPGSKVTYNGVEIGRVSNVASVNRDGKSVAELTLEVAPRYISLIPANVDAQVKASTVFGNKYVSFTSPKDPAKARISSADVIQSSGVTTEFNTLFETLTSISEKVDPVKLNLTLSAAAEALDGLGTKFGQSIVNGNAVLDDVNPQMPQIRTNIQQLSKLADVYTKASPDLWDFLDHAVTTARTLNEQQKDLDAALLASTGFGNTGADIFERGGPYFVRGQADLIPTAKLLDTYSPQLYCQIKGEAEALQPALDAFGGNGYSLDTVTEFLGAPNPYVYPDNLPRINGHGGPGGAPGCWQKIDRNFWPAPHLVVDDGASLAPYNHFELGQPILTEYVWGRQVGENTINP
ncbi:phospholipid/cholesterol/gamma-HCH transport system substrate-binding protein [Mycolicibacterium sp. BK556]|uniref:MCE family protein n=1 Tax=Mycobacteriaceae TaxID=1762 RepID=UPI00105CCE53|nr:MULTISPECIES: MCE family protein [Mycobacteriaceae]MBB3600813.1 phospholipid/cholesterol/gamma-HCH transport system substrate-binding protein [Mycolicibacterium sp. BK556]MBB3630567.1 phospholipid/cholesterol/gamma-HCH transport system substrate-binding protein [Mycolicibacterium sp. BK607]MBB3748558.1 phospholipid/cholesterol/gamma-HCH transport system substrate-binding protein [Mycolicibacterium sp. BK634]TDO10355.1 phospholipid/cholesterol/gamma-HCH transport system substrate-binding prot